MLYPCRCLVLREGDNERQKDVYTHIRKLANDAMYHDLHAALPDMSLYSFMFRSHVFRHAVSQHISEATRCVLFYMDGRDSRRGYDLVSVVCVSKGLFNVVVYTISFTRQLAHARTLLTVGLDCNFSWLRFYRVLSFCQEVPGCGARAHAPVPPPAHGHS